MSENNHEELFKTTLMGGFDKDDVMTKVQNLKDQAYAAQKMNLLLGGTLFGGNIL